MAEDEIPIPGPALQAGETQAIPLLAGKERLHVLAIALVALVPRLIYLFQIRAWPFFHYPILDSRTQWKWAGILTQSYGIGNSEVLAKAPLYAYYLALCRWLFRGEETGLFAAHLFQLLMGVATCLLTYWLGRAVFGAAVGLIAGLCLALYSPAIYRDGQLLDTSLATVLTAAFTLLFLHALAQPRNSRAWLGAGLVLGLLGLTRPNLLLLGAVSIGLMLVWLRKEVGGGAVRRAVAVLVAAVIISILPIIGRNYLITGGFVPISATGGINFYTGNNPSSDGYSPIPSGIAWERTWYQAMEAGRMTARAQDAYWREKALRFWCSQPGKGLALLEKKALLYWAAYEIPNNTSYEWGRAHSSVLRAVPLTFAVVGPLGLVGIVIGGWRSRRAWVLTLFVFAQVVAVALFFVSGRYRMPALPALCVFAGFAVTEVWRLIRARRVGALVGIVLALAVSAALVNYDWHGLRRQRAANRDWYLLGQSYFLAQDYRAARDAFRQAVEQHPDDADAYALLGQSEMLVGESEAAARDLAQALALAPDYTMAVLRLAELHLAQGWPLADVERLLRTAVDKQPRNAAGLAMLVRLDLRLGRVEQAQAALQSAVDLLSHLNRSDTRTADTAQAVMRAAAEAEHAGLKIPATLRSR
jgi:Tfp pilus assembly protein PilF/4-amino-4-deoxy-L-arabinose transferase-like glycosyltransferase